MTEFHIAEAAIRQLHAHYIDAVWRKDQDKWRYSWRLFHTCYSGPPDLSGSFFENPDFGPPPAMPGLDAPSYDRSGILAERDARRPAKDD